MKKTKILKLLNHNDLLVFLQNLSMEMKACVGNKSVLLLKTKDAKINCTRGYPQRMRIKRRHSKKMVNSNLVHSKSPAALKEVFANNKRGYIDLRQKISAFDRY